MSNSNAQTFKASLDVTSKIITAAVLMLFIYLMFRFRQYTDMPVVFRILIPVIFLVTAIGSWLYRSLSYELQKLCLVIRRPVGNFTIPYTEIASVRRVDRKELGTLIRTWGSGGMFGYYGHFRSTRLGKIRLFTTRRSGLVLIATTDKDLILLSPDDDTFADHLRQKLMTAA